MRYMYFLIIPAVFFLTLESGYGRPLSAAIEAYGNSIETSEDVMDARDFTLVSQETKKPSEAAPNADGEETAAEEPGISFSLWAAIAAVLGFGFGGLLAMRARAKAKAEKLNNQK